MPLSEHEQRLLDQIERALYAEDPKFASTVRGARLRHPSRRRRVQGIALFVIGLVLLVVGLVVPLKLLAIPVVSVIGFLVMFTGTVMFFAAMRHGGDAAESEADEKEKQRSSFAQRMEERFRRRFDEP